MPTIGELMDIPLLRPSDLKSRETLKYDSFDPKLPTWYRSWMGINFNLYADSPQPELRIFSGWKNELRERWNSQKNSIDPL